MVIDGLIRIIDDTTLMTRYNGAPLYCLYVYGKNGDFQRVLLLFAPQIFIQLVDVESLSSFCFGRPSFGAIAASVSPSRMSAGKHLDQC